MTCSQTMLYPTSVFGLIRAGPEQGPDRIKPRRVRLAAGCPRRHQPATLIALVPRADDGPLPLGRSNPRRAGTDFRFRKAAASASLSPWPFPNTASRSRASRRIGRFVCAWNASAASARQHHLPKSPTTASLGSATPRPSPSSGKSHAGSTKPSPNGHPDRRTIHHGVSKPAPCVGHWRPCGDSARLQPAHQGCRRLA